MDLGQHDFWYLYASAYHWRKLVNGASGSSPPENVAKYLTLRRGLSFPSCPPLLADLGVDYVIVHGDRMPVRAERLALADGFALCQRFGSDLVYRVTASRSPRAAPDRRWLTISPRKWQVRTNVPSSPAAWAIDGDAGTVWRTSVAPRPGMNFDIDLGDAYLLGKMAFEFGAASNEFPRYFELRVSPDGRSWRTTIAEADMPRIWADLYRSALRTPTNPRVEIAFEPTHCRYVKIELADSRHSRYAGWAWCFAEVRAYAPAP